MLPPDEPESAFETLFVLPQFCDEESVDDDALDEVSELESVELLDELVEGDAVEVALVDEVVELVAADAVAWWARLAPMPPTPRTPTVSTPAPSRRERRITGDVLDMVPPGIDL